MTKSPYRLIHWSLMLSLSATLATACVVSSGDANDDDTDIGFGGESNSGGTSSVVGGTSSSQAGSDDRGGSPSTSGGSATTNGGEPGTAGAMTTEGGAGGTGGTGSTFVPGECQVGDDQLQPTELPACEADETDDACITCLKNNSETCDPWQNCFGAEPTTACGTGAEPDELGQFECIRQCFADGAADAINPDDLLRDCGDSCGNQCALTNGETIDLITVANDPEFCQAECFPF